MILQESHEHNHFPDERQIAVLTANAEIRQAALTTQDKPAVIRLNTLANMPDESREVCHYIN